MERANFNDVSYDEAIAIDGGRGSWRDAAIAVCGAAGYSIGYGAASLVTKNEPARRTAGYACCAAAVYVYTWF